MSSGSTHPPLLSLATLDTNHRSLLSETQGDEVSSQDELSDDGPLAAGLSGEGSAEVDMIGISIGHAQNYMKSPETPAIEKFRALESSAGYFVADADSHDRISESSEGARTPPGNESGPPALAVTEPDTLPNENGTKAPPPRRAPPSHRSSLVRSVLGETTANQRGRSSSTSSTFSSLKKMLPDMPSLPALKIPGSTFSTSSEGNKQVPEVTGGDGGLRSTTTTTRGRSPVPRPTNAPRSSTRSPAPVMDGAAESLLSPLSPASTKSRGRASSESSLYMRRIVSGLSAFDDTSNFADINDMTNSRFKAITDTLQNSTLRFPKLPHMKVNILPNSHDKSSTDAITAQNTAKNASPTSRTSQYHYTTLNNIRTARKADIETQRQRAHPILSEALSRTKGDVVVLGGYRGSILRDAKSRRQVWAPVKVGLNLRNVDLEVGLEREDEERATDKIIPSGVLSHIGPIDICRRLLKHLDKCPNTKDGSLRPHDYGYDWRLSPDLLAAQLIKFLEKLKCNQPDTPPEQRGAVLIAHSLGGLITRYAVNQRPELFAGVVYAGAPQNCVNILGPLRNGDDVLLSSRVLTAQVNFTLRTSFALLPENGRCFIDRQTGERYDLDFFNPDTWDEFNLSPCISSPLHPVNREHRKSLIESLQESISSSLPSAPGKRGSWFGGQSSSSNNLSTSPERTTFNTSDNTSKTEAARDVASHATSQATRGLAESSLEPTMTLHHSAGSSSSHKPSIATICTIPLPKARAYLTRMLAEVLAFKRALVYRPEMQKQNLYPPLALMFGDTVPTVYGARVSSKEAIKYTDAFDDLTFAAGDGVVLASAAQLPDGYRCVKGGRVKSDRGHVGLLGDLEGVGQALGAVVEGRARGIGLGTGKQHHHSR